MYEIDEEVRNKAVKCDKNFACLEDANYPLCKPTDCAAKTILFIENNDKPCIYKLKFGYEQICRCPVRLALYKKYGI